MQHTGTRPVMRRATLGVILAGAGAVLFGASATLAGHLVESVEPIRLASLRLAIAGLVLAPWAVRRRSAIMRAPYLVALIGMIQISINALGIFAISRIGVGPAMGIQFLAPVLIVLWDRLAGHTRPRAVTWLAVVASVVGVALLVEAGTLADLDLVGAAAALVTAIGLAAYLRISQHTAGIIGGFPLAAGAITIGGLIGFFIAQPWTGHLGFGPEIAWGIIALGILGMAIPLSMEISSVSLVPARIVGIIITVEPVAAAVTAWVFLEQILQASQILGLALIVIAVAAVSITVSAVDERAVSTT